MSALIHTRTLKLQYVTYKSGSAWLNAVVLFDDVSLLCALTCLNERRKLPENYESEITSRKL